MSPLAKFSAGAAACLLAGCTSYFERTDKVAPYAGDAVAANRAVQMLDPWPAYASDTRIRHDGERAARAVERYRAREEGGAGGAPVIQLPLAAGAPPAQ